MTAKILESRRKPLVVFDPTNREHLQAYYDLETKGRLPDGYRFRLIAPFLDVVSMIRFTLATTYLQQVGIGSREEITRMHCESAERGASVSALKVSVRSS